MKSLSGRSAEAPAIGHIKADDAFSLAAEVVAVLTEFGATACALERVLAILETSLSLRDGRLVIFDEEGLLVPFAGQDAGTKPEKPSQKVKKLLASCASGSIPAGAPTQGASRMRGPRNHLLVAPILAENKPIGLLCVRQPTDGAREQSVNLRTLSLVANLIGPQLSFSLRTGNAGPARRIAVRPSSKPDAKKIVGESASLKAALEQARRVAGANLTVLLRGESGAGKELFAQTIHDLSPRRQKPFIKVNCAALPESVLESELFGHERGAFTGAVARRRGRFELADGGTLLLDEIGDIPLSFQAKLLRALQEGEFERVGGGRTLKVDVRVIAATHCDLEAATTNKTFRADLYYRLGVAQIRVPSLRERREDIPALAQHVLARFNAENRRAMTFHPGAIELLCKCAFPGNVRELENCVRSAAAMAHETRIVEKDFACRSRSCFSARLRQAQNARLASRRQPLAAAN